jgi:hypothetical protein
VAQVRTLAELALQARGRWPRLAPAFPAPSSSQSSSCAWFEQVRRWGTTPLTGTARLCRGYPSGPDPARAPPSKATAQAGLACRGSRRGLPCQAGSATRSAAAPTSEYVARTLADDVVVRGAGVSVCLGRPGGRLAGHRWLGQGFQQRPDLGIEVASMAAQGPEVGQPPLLGPATHRLRGHLEELGDLRCPEVPRLGWLWHRMLHSRRVSLRWGRPYAHGERTPSSVLPTAAQPPVDRLRTG